MVVSCENGSKPGTGVLGIFQSVQNKKSLNRRVQAKKKHHGPEFQSMARFRVCCGLFKQPDANELGSSPPLPRHVVSCIYLVEEALRMRCFFVVL